jgi:16S rRNA (uracil1498-N3)-methyltransferase
MCTELGVSAYVPVLSARSVVRLGREAGARKQGRWERVVEEAAKQCGRTQVPQVLAPLRWEEALERYTSVGVPGVMPSAGLAGSDARSLGDAAAELAARSRHGVALFIGPESGFDLAEEASAEAAGVTLVTMGPRILRTETAAVVASAILLDRLGEMQ